MLYLSGQSVIIVPQKPRKVPRSVGDLLQSIHLRRSVLLVVSKVSESTGKNLAITVELQATLVIMIIIWQRELFTECSCII